MEFQILGPLEVRLEGGQVPLGAAKQRALLAILLVHANELVPSCGPTLPERPRTPFRSTSESCARPSSPNGRRGLPASCW